MYSPLPLINLQEEVCLNDVLETERNPFISEKLKMEAYTHCQRLMLGFLPVTRYCSVQLSVKLFVRQFHILFDAETTCPSKLYTNMTIFTRTFTTQLYLQIIFMSFIGIKCSR